MGERVSLYDLTGQGRRISVRLSSCWDAPLVILNKVSSYVFYIFSFCGFSRLVCQVGTEVEAYVIVTWTRRLRKERWKSLLPEVVAFCPRLETSCLHLKSHLTCHHYPHHHLTTYSMRAYALPPHHPQSLVSRRKHQPLMSLRTEPRGTI